jgi:hypothetical protein
MKRPLLDTDVAASLSWSTNDKPQNITITNSTGSTQSYALFADTPKITPGVGDYDVRSPTPKGLETRSCLIDFNVL